MHFEDKERKLYYPKLRLQNYLNWFKVVVTVLKKEANHANALLRLSMMENKVLFATQ